MAVGLIIIAIILIVLLIVVIWFLSASKMTQPAPETRYAIRLNSDQIIPLTSEPSDPSGSTGLGQAILAANEQSLKYNLMIQNLSSQISGAAIYQAASGHNGQHLKDLNYVQQGARAQLSGIWSYNDTPALTSHIVNSLKTNQLYILIQTSNYPQGEIRGQILHLIQ